MSRVGSLSLLSWAMLAVLAFMPSSVYARDVSEKRLPDIDARDERFRSPLPTVNDENYRLPLNPQLVDKALLEAPQRPFDADIWRSDINQRQSMLLDLLRKLSAMYDRQQRIEMLGAPWRIGIDGSSDTDLYELGQYCGQSIFLEVCDRIDYSPMMMIGQHSSDGYLYLFAGEWHWQNPDVKGAAKELNKLFYIVGAPCRHLCQFVGHPVQIGPTWRSGPIEFEFTKDNLKVKRFRLSPDEERYSKLVTRWEDKDLRVVPGSYSNAFDFLYASEYQDAWLVRPGSEFSQADWNKLFCREYMLFDLTHSKSLIGKSRAEIHALLGEPTYSESKPSADRRVTYFRRRIEGPAPFNRFDWFALNRTGCVEPAEPSQFFEIVYSRDPLMGDIAMGYRCLKSGKYQDGKTEILGNILTRDVGYLCPNR